MPRPRSVARGGALESGAVNARLSSTVDGAAAPAAGWVTSPEAAIGVPAGDGGLAVLALADWTRRTLPRPAGARETALRPALDRLAVATADEVLITDHEDRLLDLDLGLALGERR
jgi:hypothetical protein